MYPAELLNIIDILLIKSAIIFAAMTFGEIFKPKRPQRKYPAEQEHIILNKGERWKK